MPTLYAILYQHNCNKVWPAKTQASRQDIKAKLREISLYRSQDTCDHSASYKFTFDSTYLLYVTFAISEQYKSKFVCTKVWKLWHPWAFISQKFYLTCFVNNNVLLAPLTPFNKVSPTMWPKKSVKLTGWPICLFFIIRSMYLYTPCGLNSQRRLESMLFLSSSCMAPGGICGQCGWEYNVEIYLGNVKHIRM